MNKKTFCLLVNAMKKQYDTDIAIYSDLKKYNIYVDIENNILTKMTEDLININFPDEWVANEIFDYVYSGEPEKETPEELYNRTMKEIIIREMKND